ncbi:MAG TPA: DUF2934 domain-containing protein [Lacunisphaera sp.]|nr:DUF2934 domain-containing protein [Lacunisphaera sp.]
MASKNSSPLPTLAQPTHEEIAQRARELWESRGQPSGQDDTIWLEAERELHQASSPAVNAAGAPAVPTSVKQSPAGGGRGQRREAGAGGTARSPTPASPPL